MNIVTDFVKRIQVRDARTKVMKSSNIWISMSERRRGFTKTRRKSTAWTTEVMAMKGDYMDEDDLFHYRDRDRDSDDEEEQIGTKDEEDFHSGRDSHH